MDVIVRGKHFDVQEHVEQRARTKLSRLERYLPLLGEAAAEVDVAHERAKEPDQRYVVHVTVSGRGVHLQAEERAASPEAAIDRAVQVLSRQARREKDRLYERNRKPGLKAAATPAVAGAAGDEPETTFPELVGRVKRFAVKPMTVQEALTQMDVLGHSFFLFHDADDDQIALLYRRRAGDYGLIIPELP